MTEAELQAECDRHVAHAAAQMGEAGACAEMIIDRMLTYAIAQACVLSGSKAAAAALIRIAVSVNGGLFQSITGEGARH